MRLAAGVVVLWAAVSATVAHADRPERHVESALGVWRQSGKASWYGPGFNGHRAACGSIYDEMASTAAHLHFPCGTVLRVTNPRNGRSEIVTITDRGPYVRGRVIDLSRGTARRLGLETAGLGEVLIEVLR
jgi:rare lipoprotein A